MDTNRFRTRQERKPLSLPKGKDYIIAPDMGYSSVKGFCETGYFCFPSYAKKLDGDMINLPDTRDIMYRNEETGEVYLVGYNAQSMADGTNDTEGELYSRRRYTGERFRILCQTAVGLAAKDKAPERKITVQTGLPASYMKDIADLKKAFSSMPTFSLKAGTEKTWTTYNLTIKEDDIYVMEQPKGALYSSLIYNNGSYTKDAMRMLKGSVMVMDAGFRTFDFYGIKDRRVECHESIDDIGMYQVFSETEKKIEKKYGEEVRVPTLQRHLTSGLITCVNEETMGSEEVEFSELLEAANNEVFESAKSMIRSITNAFRGYQYVIVDGGTGEAWYGKICDWLKGMKTLRVLPSNLNDRLPFLYSNARGYYMYRYTAGKR